MKKFCFTGHRTINADSKLKKCLYEILESFIRDGAEDFYVGGALGWDTLCALTVLELKEVLPQIKLHLVLPCPEDEQTKGWSSAEKLLYHKILLSADTVEVCSAHYENGCMKKRNKRLVDYAECCVCFYDEKKHISGTGQTVRMANNKGIKVVNLYPQKDAAAK